jgi:fermentation-respiration switch protein FrsA (DUF1100 family)
MESISLPGGVMGVTLWRGVLVALALPLMGCVSSPSTSRELSFEESLIFHPRPFPDHERQPGDAEFEDAWFNAPDGVRLHGWYAEADRPGAVVLYTHGNAGNIADRRQVLRLFRDELNASILVFDYRGYGRSEGIPGEEGVLADARAARRWLAQRAGVPEPDIVVVGNSLGGAVAVDLAARDGARGLVLENTFTSMPDVAASHFKVLPIHWLMRTRLDSAAKIPDYRGPLLQTHGTADEVVPFALGQRLFKLANEPKQFVPVSGGGHNDPPPRHYVLALKRFLESLQ